MVRLEARAMLVLKSRCYPAALRGKATSAISTDRSLEGGVAPSSNLISFRDLITSSTKPYRSEEHTSELQSRPHLVCRLLLEKKKKKQYNYIHLIYNTNSTTLHVRL